MPNHVTNILEISADGDEELITKILEEIKGELDCIDFRVIVPESPAAKHSLDWAPNDGTTQDLTWYDEHCEKWGTKWNAYDQSYEDLGYGCHQLTFDTAWSPPLPIVEALRQKYPGAYFAGHWVEEGHQSAGVF